jgi:hypothetical protein
MIYCRGYNQFKYEMKAVFSVTVACSLLGLCQLSEDRGKQLSSYLQSKSSLKLFQPLEYITLDVIN